MKGNENKAETLIKKASGYAMQGDFGTSLGFTLQAYELYLKEHGEESLDTLACAGLVGRTYAALGRGDDALRYFTMVYEGLLKTLGEESQKTQHAYHELEDYKAHLQKIRM